MHVTRLPSAWAAGLALCLLLPCMVAEALGDQGPFFCSAGSSAQFMRCLNQTSGVQIPVVLNIERAEALLKLLALEGPFPAVQCPFPYLA